jgi:phosphoribosylaminoimidazolecarboxamide formyltransferase/IMP cyclohydrolase
VAPSYEQEALEVLTQKKNIRLLQLADIEVPQNEYAYDMKKVNGGLIVQTIDSKIYKEDELKVVTDRAPSYKEMEDLKFAWKVVKFVKSNGIALAKDQQSIGIGPGQVNRIWSTKQSIEHAGELIGEGITRGAVLASDAFFPFDDCVEAAYQAGITAIIQPGGASRDEDSIKKCNEYGIAMIFTGMRHFKH